MIIIICSSRIYLTDNFAETSGCTRILHGWGSETDGTRGGRTKSCSVQTHWRSLRDTWYFFMRICLSVQFIDNSPREWPFLCLRYYSSGTPGHARTMRRQLRQSPSMKWIVDYAPAPSDIYWENLSIARPCWYFNAILINSFLCLVLFFLTTPAVSSTFTSWTLNLVNCTAERKRRENLLNNRHSQVVVTAVKSIPTTDSIIRWSPLLSAFLPTVLLVSVAALMPAIVGRSELLVRHWTRSGLNGAILKKTLLLLLLMVLILPSLGLTSAQAFFEWTITAGNDTAKWECVFLPDQVWIPLDFANWFKLPNRLVFTRMFLFILAIH